MPKDDRDILEVLKAELNFLEDGGYGRSVRTPWKPTRIFRDSLTCLNFCDSEETRPCAECLLMEFVPAEKRAQRLPCHQIPLTPKGETAAGLEWKGNQSEVEEALKTWLRTQISLIEKVRKTFDGLRNLPTQKLLPPMGDRKRLLIVDGDEDVLIALQVSLEDAGFDTTTAWSGQEALRLLREQEFDGVLLEDYLPGISAEEVLRQVRRMSPDIPVVILQNGEFPDYLATRYSRLGATYFIGKRDAREVAEMVDGYFARSSVCACALNQSCRSATTV
jgi:CheY-like chemotaxis protein